MLDFYSRQPSANSHERSVDMEIRAKQATVKGPAQTFTGDVWFDVVVRDRDYSRYASRRERRRSRSTLAVIERKHDA